MKVKGKNHMKVIDGIATDAMTTINELQAIHFNPEDPFVKVRYDKLFNVSNGFLYLYNMMMEQKQIPSPKNQRRFHEVYH
jgi:hypothetical protein